MFHDSYMTKALENPQGTSPNGSLMVTQKPSGIPQGTVPKGFLMVTHINLLRTLREFSPKGSLNGTQNNLQRTFRERSQTVQIFLQKKPYKEHS